MSQQYKERDFGHWTVGDFIRCGDVMRNHNEMSEEISRLRAQLADAGNLWAHIKNRQYWDDVHAADMAVNGPTEFGVREGWTYINDLTRMLKGAAPPAGHFSCPYCPIEGITTKGEYEKHRATHEKPAAPVPEPDWEGIAASAAENRDAPAAPQPWLCEKCGSDFVLKNSQRTRGRPDAWICQDCKHEMLIEPARKSPNDG